MPSAIKISNLSKVYKGGLEALKNINLEIEDGEIFALLGPNGAGKTTLISIICGIVNPSAGTVHAGGYDIIKEYRETRSLIGLVPQEISLNPFETVLDSVAFSRGLFGKQRDPDYLEDMLKKLSLWDKKDGRILELSGGMKRRVLIAKALSHQPKILFLDEPTAGVDVALRAGMWQTVRELRDSGVTVILTTHYIEEAEEMADRVGVINRGEIILVEEKSALMAKLGKKQLTLELTNPLSSLASLSTLPGTLSQHLTLSKDGNQLIYSYDTNADRTGITTLLQKLSETGITFRDLHTSQSSLEDIFVDLVERPS